MPKLWGMCQDKQLLHANTKMFAKYAFMPQKNPYNLLTNTFIASILERISYPQNFATIRYNKYVRMATGK